MGLIFLEYLISVKLRKNLKVSSHLEVTYSFPMLVVHSEYGKPLLNVGYCQYRRPEKTRLAFTQGNQSGVITKTISVDVQAVKSSSKLMCFNPVLGKSLASLCIHK